MNCAGIGIAKRMIGRDGPMPLADFERVIRVNLIGTFNVTRLATHAMTALEPLEDGERGVVISTASVAAFDGQVGQPAYAASKGGVASLTLPLARELAQFGIRVMTIAPGLFDTPMMAGLPPEIQASLGASVPFPKRLGRPEEYAQLAVDICENVLPQRRDDPARRRDPPRAPLTADGRHAGARIAGRRVRRPRCRDRRGLWRRDEERGGRHRDRRCARRRIRSLARAPLS